MNARESFASMDDRGAPEPTACEEARAKLFGFVESGAEEADLPTFAAALDAYSAEMTRANADWLEGIGQDHAASMLRYSLDLDAQMAAAVPVPDETGEEYPGELAHLRDLLRGVGRLADKQPKGNPLTELLIDHYSDSRMVDAQLAKRGDR